MTRAKEETAEEMETLIQDKEEALGLLVQAKVELAEAGHVQETLESSLRAAGRAMAEQEITQSEARRTSPTKKSFWGMK